jgi:hypothetical protein
MEVSSMKRNQLLKELQSHKKYRNKTQKEIADKLGGVNEFRIELTRLNKKSSKIKVENINNIKNNKEKTTNTILPADAMYEILLRSDLSTTQKLLQTSKSIKNNNDLWKNKIIRDYPFFQFHNEDDLQNVYLALYKSHLKAKEILLVTQLLALDHDEDYIHIKYIKEYEFNLPSLLLENIKKQVINYQPEMIFLTPKGHNYEIQYVVNDGIQEYESTILIDLSIAIDILTSLIYLNVDIEDDKNLNLLKKYNAGELSDMRSYKRDSYYKRNHMLDILKFFDKL